MLLRFAADAVLISHLAFILFVTFGGMLVFHCRRIMFIHVPAAAWGIFVELTGRICPLTYLENRLRQAAGQNGYSESFIEHYMLPVIYPANLTPSVQYLLAGIVLTVNCIIYIRLIARKP